MKRFNRLRGTPHRRWQCWNSGLHAVHVFVDSHQPLRDFEQEAVQYHITILLPNQTALHHDTSNNLQVWCVSLPTPTFGTREEGVEWR